MYEVFISFKNLDEKGNQTRDSKLAEELYLKLIDAGIEVFFSNREIERRGDPRWGKLIDRALRESKVMVVVGTKLSYIESEWVEYEWGYFSEQIRSGSDKQILTLLEGLHPSSLPPAFSGTQSYSSSFVDSLVDMAVKIVKGVTQENTTAPAAYTAPTAYTAPKPVSANVYKSQTALSVENKTNGFFSAGNITFFLYYALALVTELISFLAPKRGIPYDFSNYFFSFVSLALLIASIVSLRRYNASMPPKEQMISSVISIAFAVLSWASTMIYMIGVSDDARIFGYYALGYYSAITLSIIGFVFSVTHKKNYLTVASAVICLHMAICAIITPILFGGVDLYFN